MKNRKIIGILGGMGPQASAKLVEILVDLSTKEFGAKNCEDFPEIVLDSTPHPDFISNKKNKEATLELLKERVKRLNLLKADILAVSCNTAHILLPNLQSVSKAPFVSIIEEIIRELRRKRINRVGLLASPTTLESDIFQKAFRPERSVWPERWFYNSSKQEAIKSAGNNH